MVMRSGDKSTACPLSYKADAADPGHDYPSPQAAAQPSVRISHLLRLLGGSKRGHYSSGQGKMETAAEYM